MDENTKETTKASVPTIAGFIIVIIILVVGYFWWPQGDTTVPASNTDAYSTSTDPFSTSTPAVPTETATTTTTLPSKNFMHTITIETNKGKIVFETYDADAPKASQNFVGLAQKGFYDGVIFHRIISGFMIQGGDPTGTGAGGPGYKFADELNPETESYKKGYLRGTVAMANSGSNTNGSQFFIMHADYPLPHKYTIFGRVISGMDVVDAIATAPKDGGDRPLEQIVMRKVTVQEK